MRVTAHTRVLAPAPSTALPALPEALLDVVLRMLDSLAPEWPDRRALVAVCAARQPVDASKAGGPPLTSSLPQACSVCRAWRRVGRHVLAPLHWTPGASAGDWASPARLLVPVRSHPCHHARLDFGGSSAAKDRP